MYLFVALTRLTTDEGWFLWEGQEQNLELGDARIWPGDCERQVGGGGGGIVLKITYR